MHSQCWNVLIVDDEPDVLSISRLAMKKISIYGVPICIHAASSKAEAVTLLNTTLGGPSSLLAVAIIDVVMESDHAGLELCQYIREGLNNRVTQIYIRTGQPGIAPERSVVDRYEINGYLSKTEATQDKLYSIVKSAVREYGFARILHAGGELLQELIQVADSRELMLQVIRDFSAGRGGRLAETDIQSRYFINDRMVEAGQMPDQDALARRDRLARAEGTRLNAEGDRYILEEGSFLIEVAPSRTCAALSFVGHGAIRPPELWLRILHGQLRAFAALWKKAVNYSANRV